MKPTLAQKFDPKKVQWPALVSPKLDGIRCMVEVTDEGVKLWSRDEKPILSVQHIVLQLNALVTQLNIPVGTWLDGELFTKAMPFQNLNGTVRRQYFDERALPIKLYLFDVARDADGLHTQTFEHRLNALMTMYAKTGTPGAENSFGIPTDVQTQLGHLHPWLNAYLSPNVAVLAHVRAYTHGDVERFERDFLAAGLEGAMVRTDVFDKKAKAWRPCGYETEASGHTRRTWGLQKVKTFEDAEFRIVGVFEEHDLDGRPKGRAAGFVMEDEQTAAADGVPVRFNASGLTDAQKAEVWEKQSDYIGQLATVKFFGRSSDGVPRHPNFKALRPEGQMDAAD
ncbi:ATP-dependent DNA ligase [Deinococcus kurensis]|uniref:ATP-dependent DNA ligase n=1 Tax=Deinococcus kurensis TaxID=2662757 RepID=UPI0012D36F64|nr:hypothetical protein [Deinococcus kurensis]